MQHRTWHYHCHCHRLYSVKIVIRCGTMQRAMTRCTKQQSWLSVVVMQQDFVLHNKIWIGSFFSASARQQEFIFSELSVSLCDIVNLQFQSHGRVIYNTITTCLYKFLFVFSCSREHVSSLINYFNVKHFWSSLKSLKSLEKILISQRWQHPSECMFHG